METRPHHEGSLPCHPPQPELYVTVPQARSSPTRRRAGICQRGHDPSRRAVSSPRVFDALVAPARGVDFATLRSVLSAMGKRVRAFDCRMKCCMARIKAGKALLSYLLKLRGFGTDPSARRPQAVQQIILLRQPERAAGGVGS